VAGEAIASVTGPVRIICNSDLDPQDLITAAAAQAALRRSWCAGKPVTAPPADRHIANQASTKCHRPFRPSWTFFNVHEHLKETIRALVPSNA